MSGGGAQSPPIRPGVPLLALGGLAFWAVCALAVEVGRTIPQVACLAGVLGGVALALSAVLLLCMCPARKTLSALVAFALAGAALGCSHSYALHGQVAAMGEKGSLPAFAQLEQDPKPGAYGYTLEVCMGQGFGAPARASLYVDSAEGLYAGSVIHVQGSVGAHTALEKPALWRKGACCAATARVLSAKPPAGTVGILWQVRRRAVEGMRAAGMPNALLAVVCGWRVELLRDNVYADFRSCGLAHLVAVSGAHLALLCGLATSLLRSLGVPRRPLVGVLVAFMGLYVLFAGHPVSALRACAMATVALLAFTGRRRPHTMNALGVAVVALLVADPSQALSVSFALSALSTFGIVALAPLFAWWVGKVQLGVLGFAADALAVTIAANVATQPLSCALFSQLPLVSPAANILAAPLLVPVCGFGILAALAAAAGCGPLLLVLGVPARVACGALAALAHALAQLPYSCVPASAGVFPALLASALAVAALWAFWPVGPGKRASWAAAFCAVLLAFLVRAPAGDRVTMLDVGQGDAVLFQSCGATLLVDTGNQDARLLAGLAEAGAARVDVVLVTHGDDDHCGSLDALATAADVGCVALAADTFETRTDRCENLVSQAGAVSRTVAPLHLGDRLSVGRFTAHVVWPHSFADEGGNADSLCLLVEYDPDADGAADFAMLLTGDAEAGQLQAIMDEQELGQVDVLKVGHHGSADSITAEQAELLSPRIALIGVGAQNRYGHPNPDTVAALQDVGCSVYRTDEDGAISCEFSKRGIVVRTQR